MVWGRRHWPSAIQGTYLSAPSREECHWLLVLGVAFNSPSTLSKVSSSTHRWTSPAVGFAGLSYPQYAYLCTAIRAIYGNKYPLTREHPKDILRVYHARVIQLTHPCSSENRLDLLPTAVVRPAPPAASTTALLNPDIDSSPNQRQSRRGQK